MNDLRLAFLPQSNSASDSQEQPSLTRVIYQKVREEILNGSLGPGVVLRQEELAARFSSSRVPLREALSQLEAEGLVASRPRRGFVVSSLDPIEVIELMQLRIVVEEHAGYVATLVRREADIRAVEACLKVLDNLPTRNPDESERLQWLTANQRFHDALVASSGRSHLRQMAANIQAKIGRYIQIELVAGGDLPESQEEHRHIARAFADGNATLVAQICREHCEKTAVRFAKVLEAKGMASDLLASAVLDYGPPRE